MKTEEYRAMFELEHKLWWYRGMRAVTAAILEHWIPAKKDLRILDIGCGTGYSMKWLTSLYGSKGVFGVDVSQEAAVFWKRGEVETAAIASAYGLPFGEGLFDLVTCFDVIYQLNREMTERSILEMRRVLRP